MNPCRPAPQRCTTSPCLNSAVARAALAIWYRQDPWLIALGAGAITATIVMGAALGVTTNLLGPAYAIVLLLLATLLGYLWRKAVSTQRGFMKASSIYVGSKEALDTDPSASPQKPWLGLTQWAALITASIALAIANSLLRGTGIEEIPAVEVATESGLLLLVTASCAPCPPSATG
jgi:hypothetical protein